MSDNPMDWIYRITMPDGSKWDVPVKVIAENRAHYYAHQDGKTYSESLEYDTLPLFKATPYEIEDWAADNMNWDDISSYAIRVPETLPTIDWQEGWLNGRKEIIR